MGCISERGASVNGNISVWGMHDHAFDQFVVCLNIRKKEFSTLSNERISLSFVNPFYFEHFHFAFVKPKTSISPLPPSSSPVPSPPLFTFIYVSHMGRKRF